MTTWQIILAIVAFSCIFGMFLAAVFARLNGDDDINETNEREPLGDMVDVRRVINRYED